MRTAVSIPYKAQGNSPSSRPSSATSVPRISLSLGGIRSYLGSTSRPPAAPVSAVPGTPAQTDCPGGIIQRDHAVDLASPAVDMQSTATRKCNVLQQKELQPAAVQSQTAKGSKQRSQSAQALAHRPLSGNSKTGKRPQSAVTPTVQPPFWTGSMQQVESSYQVDDCWRQPELHQQSGLQQPPAEQDAAQQGSGHGITLQQSQSGADSSQPSHKGVSNVAAAGNQALRTVPEDDATALQPGQFRQTALPEGRAGSLRAWQGLYTQASVSDAASNGQQSQTLNSTSRPTSAAKQQRSSRPSTAATSSSAFRPNSASGPRGSQRQEQQQAQQQTHSSSASGQNQGMETGCTLSGTLQSSVRGRGTSRGQGDSSTLTGCEGQEQADLTEAERCALAVMLSACCQQQQPSTVIHAADAIVDVWLWTVQMCMQHLCPCNGPLDILDMLAAGSFTVNPKFLSMLMPTNRCRTLC